MPPHISVVVPVYNAGKYLQATLQSICRQTLPGIEIICVDDGSTDNSCEILQATAAKDQRFRIIRQENAGPGVARNTGMRAASGEYLAFLDADDLYEPDMLETMFCQAKSLQADVIVCQCDYFSASLEERHYGSWHPDIPEAWIRSGFHPAEDAPSRIFQLCVGWPWDKLFRTEYIRTNGWDYPPLRNSEDGVFVYPAVAHAQTMAICNRTLAHHREHPGSVSKTLNRWPTECIKAIQLIHERLGKLNQNPGISRSFSSWARHYAAWNLRELECEARTALREDVRNKLEPQFRLAGLQATDLLEYHDYKSMVSPAARIEILAEPDNLDTLRECIRSIEEQEKVSAEIVIIPQGGSIPAALLAGTRAYPSLPNPASCPVLRLSASRGIKWNTLPKAIRAASSCGELPTAYTYDIRKRERFYSHTATTRTWRLWGRGILTLKKKDHGTAVFLLGHMLWDA